MTQQSSAELVREYFRTVWVEGHWDRVHEFVSDAFVNHGSITGMPSTSIEDAAIIDGQMRAVFPDGRIAEEWRIVDNAGLIEQLRRD